MADQDDLSPGLEEAVGLMAKAATGKMCVGTFGHVLEYEAATQKAKVRPVIRGNREQADGFQYPIISNVPVTFPASGDFSITWPLKAGDYVWLNFADRSIDEWLTLGGNDVTPRDKRRFHVTDAVALPGGRPFNKPLVLASDEELVIGQDGYDGPISNPGDLSEPLQIRIGPQGMRIGDGTSTNDLFNILYDLATALTTAFYSGATPTIVMTPTSVAAIQAIRDRLDSIRKP